MIFYFFKVPLQERILTISIMKKYAVLLISAVLLVACSKKENTDVESNVMLEEPTSTVVSSQESQQNATPETASTDSLATEAK